MTILQRLKIIDKTRKILTEKSKKISLSYHSSVILLGLLLSVIIYYIIVKSINLKFQNPETTTISWFTVNNYPRQQDYFYFFTSFIFITIYTCIFWVMFIWLKKTK